MYRFLPSGVVSDLSETDYVHDLTKTDAFIRIDNEGHTVNTEGKITVNYPIANNNIVVTEVNSNTAVEVDSYTGSTILLTGATAGSQVAVTYNSKIIDMETQGNAIITIDITTFKYKHRDTDEEYASGKDVYYSETDKKVYLNLNSTIPTNQNGMKTAYVSFKFKKKSKEEFEIYRTYVYYDRDTTLTIYPFTQEEYSAGNFHMIDGVNVSTNTSYDIKGGWHEIMTTQPYKTDPDNIKDVNSLTNKQSTAGINLGSYIERRAYSDPMRLVSTHTLANVVGPNNNESFAYKNGKIYTNFIPTYLPDYATTDATHLKGNKVLAKEAEYYATGKEEFKQYIHKPEKILLEYNTRPKSGTTNDVRNIYLKGTLKTNTETHTSPNIFRFDVLFY